jgi:hypothetical protein
LDLKKAYDCVSWDFLQLILAQTGFSANSSSWIMSCVTSASFAVLINGETSEFFNSERGLRQGCPLSPLLFILVMESLSILLKKSQELGNLTGVKVSRVVKILHLIFVDDVLIMTKASTEEWQLIKIILDQFCSASGLHINYSKSTIHHVGLEADNLARFKVYFLSISWTWLQDSSIWAILSKPRKLASKIGDGFSKSLIKGSSIGVTVG